MSEPRQDLWEAISFFEKIVETMPDDRVSLEFLAGAYEQTGDANRARATWTQLATVILSSGETEGAQTVRQHLTDYADDPEISTLIARLDALVDGTSGPSSPPRASSTKRSHEAHPVQRHDISLDPAQLRMAAAFEEVNLAWTLHEQGVIEEQDYEQMTIDLTEGVASLGDGPVSALLDLHRQQPEKTDSAVLFLAERYALPPIRLDAFEISEEIRALLPPIFACIRGAFPFARLGRHVMVAVLNPADVKLRAEIEALTGGPCTFYLAHPERLDTVLERFPLA